MNKFAVTCLLLLPFLILKTTAQDSLLHKRGFSAEMGYTGDFVSNHGGGIKTGSCYLGLFNFGISLEMSDAGLWKGGSAYFNVTNTHGAMPAANLTGDLQGVSNIDAGNRTYIHEAWFRQSWGKALIIAGIQDLNKEFINSSSAGLFLNGSFGTPFTISANLPVPIFPFTSPGIQIHYHFSDQIIAKAGLFDKMLTVAELEISETAEDKSERNIRIGLCTLPGRERKAIPGEEFGFLETSCLYLIADIKLPQERAGQSFSFFTQVSYSPSSTWASSYYLGGGINQHTPFRNRPDDIAGFAFAHTGSPEGSETTFELTYKAQLFDFFYLQPDIQYILNPGGLNGTNGNALVTIIRFGLSI